MAKIRVQRKDEEIGTRARAVARQAVGRIFAGPAGVYLVRGDPDPISLAHRLRQVTAPPSPAAAPTATELGFQAPAVSRLTPEELAAYTGALKKWAVIVKDREGLRHIRPDLRRKMDDWRAEIRTITAQLDELYAALRTSDATGTSPGSTYRIPAAARRQIEDMLRAEAAAGVPALWIWFGRVVAWISGPGALRRFLDSIRPEAGRVSNERDRQAVRALRESVKAALQYAPAAYREAMARGRCKWIPTERARGSPDLADIIDAIERLPPRLVRRGAIRLPGRPHETHDYLRTLAARCDAILEATPEPPSSRAIAAVAALCACDNAEVVYSVDLLDDNPSLQESLQKQIGKPGYGALVSFISHASSLPRSEHILEEEYFDGARTLLSRGASAEDVAWAINILRSEFTQYACKESLPGPIRSVVQAFAGAGVEFDAEDVERFLSTSGTPGVYRIFEALASWLSGLPFGGMAPEFTRALRGAILFAAAPQEASPAFRDHLARWLNPPGRLQPPPGCPAGMPSELAEALARLAYYQKLAGRKPGLPISLRKALDTPGRESRERDHLESLGRKGQLTAAMRLRLERLKTRSPVESNERFFALLPEARQACAFAALDALRHGVVLQTKIQWDQVFHCPPPNGIQPQDCMLLLDWVRRLDPKERATLESLAAAWREVGERYRETIPANKLWIKQAASNGVELEHWMTPPPEEAVFSGRKLRIEASLDPFRTLLMGTWFKTCLSLDSFNCKAVIANAHDANKAVLYLRGENGEVLGRKLVGLNRQFCMVGFRTYVALEEELAAPIEDWIASYCGKWARQANVRLANSGLPDSLQKLFWYDDGIEPWGPAASTGADPTRAGIDPVLAKMLESRANDCRKLLEDVGIWPQGSAEALPALLQTPALAEEALAWLADSQKDEHLAETVLDHCAGEGGRLMALSALTRLRGETMMEDCMAYYCGQARSGEAAAGILADIDRPASWKWLMRLIADHQASEFWLPAAALRSPIAIDAIIENIGAFCHCCVFPGPVLLAIEITRSLWKKTPPDNSLKDLISHWTAPAASWYDLLAVAQWLPPFSEPTRILTMDLLESILEAAKRSLPEDRRTDPTLPAALVALKNPCPAAKKFLRQHAEGSAAAVLCLALLEPRRFEDVIIREASAMPWEPALAMAIVASFGVRGAIRWFAERGPGGEEHRRFVENTAKLYESYSGVAPESMSDRRKLVDEQGLGNCIPVLMKCLWRHCEDLDSGNPSAGIVLYHHLEDLENAIPIAVRYSRRLASAKGEEADRLMHAVSGLVGDSAPLAPIVMDALSAGHFSSHHLHRFQLAALIETSAAPRFLFDSDGRLTSLASAQWEDRLDEVALPLDPLLCMKLLRLAVEHFTAEEVKRACNPQTEIQRRLVDRWV